MHKFISMFSLLSHLYICMFSQIYMYAWQYQAILSSSVIFPSLFFLLIISLTFYSSLWLYVTYTVTLSISVISSNGLFEFVECFSYYEYLNIDCSNSGRQNIFLLFFVFFKLIH